MHHRTAMVLQPAWQLSCLGQLKEVELLGCSSLNPLQESLGKVLQQLGRLVVSQAASLVSGHRRQA